MSKSEARSLIEDYHLLSYQELDSTNEEAHRLAQGGASHGAVIWARKQSAGRGRMGREWISREGNLFVSILLSPEAKLVELPQLSFVAAIALLEAIAPIVEDAGGDVGSMSLKWPNDVLLNNKKLAGILLESFSENGKQWVCVGVGVNVENHPQQVAYPATCLKDAGVQIISAKIVLARFIDHFIQNYDIWQKDGFAPISKKWQTNAANLGKEITVQSGKDKLSGVFKKIDHAGRMLLEAQDKITHCIDAGDVLV